MASVSTYLNFASSMATGGKVTMELQDMFWGDYFGSLIDKYGVQWMVNCSAK